MERRIYFDNQWQHRRKPIVMYSLSISGNEVRIGQPHLIANLNQKFGM